MYEHGMIAPVVALIIWSLVMLIWLYATRIPAMAKARVRPGEATKAQMDALPGTAPNVANNYNHLMEQPTIFYALCFALQFLDQDLHTTIVGQLVDVVEDDVDVTTPVFRHVLPRGVDGLHLVLAEFVPLHASQSAVEIEERLQECAVDALENLAGIEWLGHD